MILCEIKTSSKRDFDDLKQMGVNHSSNYPYWVGSLSDEEINVLNNEALWEDDLYIETPEIGDDVGTLELDGKIIKFKCRFANVAYSAEPNGYNLEIISINGVPEKGDQETRNACIAFYKKYEIMKDAFLKQAVLDGRWSNMEGFGYRDPDLEIPKFSDFKINGK